MKKKAISFLTAFLTAISCTATMLPTITRTAIAASTSNVKFDEDEFYVAVGTCKGATQLRYFAQKSDGGYTVEKVVWEDAPVDISYGDVFIGDGNIEMTKVMAAPDNPVYAMAYYYQLDDGTKLNKVGKCDDLMEKKVLTVSSKTYDGSAHWSIRYKDSDGKEYYYGLSNFASTLTVDPLDCEVGDVYTYALCNDYMVIPLAKENDISDVYTEPEYKIVKLPDKVEYKLGEQIDLKGIEIEVTMDKKEPVVYTYPDVAFDYQSNIPRAPRVILHSDFRSDKAGTYKVEVVGADNVCFDVKVVDDSTIKDIAVFTEGETMTFDDVIELSKKGNALTLNDFAKFKGVIAGSGIFILEYDLGKGYTLMVGSVALDKIDYARLRYSGSENYIDIRTDDVEKYLSDSAQVSNIKGDANCDGQVDLSDAVMIMQALANPNKYGLDGTAEHHLTEQGKLNGDMNGDGLTSGDALAIQRKLLGLDKTDDQSLDSSLIANKLFIYEKETALGVYDISFGDNGKYYCHQGHFDAARDWGTWNISGDTVVLTGQFGTNRFSFKDNALIYIEEGSDGFNDVKPKDGEQFNLAPEMTYDVQTKSMNGVAVSIKSDLRPHMSDLSGIGILLEVNSNDYPVTLKATDGSFVKWDIEKGSGPVKTVGKEYDIGKNGYIFWNPDKLYYQDGFESEIQVIGVSGDVFIDVGKIYVSQVKGGIFEASFEKPEPSVSTDNSVIAGKIFAYEKEGAGGYCTLSFNENGRFLYSPGKLSSYMGGGDWKIDGDTVSLIGMVDKTIYLKITDDTLVYIAESSDEFPYMDIKDGEKFAIYRPEISSDKFQLNSRYSEYGLGNPKVELNLMASELPEFCYVENVRLYDEDDNFIGMMSPAMDADIWSYLVDCNITEECSKTYYTLTKIRCGQKTYLDDVRSEITVNFKGTPAP